jgi:predicted ATP-dependent endonuclease of OLD family
VFTFINIENLRRVNMGISSKEMEQMELFPLDCRDKGLSKIEWKEGGIKSLKVKNFKKFKDFTIDFSEMTLLVGTNNSGKSSILQSIRLFFWCIQECAIKNKNKYKFTKKVFPFSDFSLIPAHELRELSYQGLTPNSQKRGIVLEGTLKNGCHLKFCIYSSYNTQMVINPETTKLNLILTDEEFQFINRSPLYIPGFFGIVTKELLSADARLEGLLNSGHHNEVLRNIILRLKQKDEKLTRLVELMKQEFGITNMDIPFESKTSEFLKAAYKEPENRIALDFVSGGSGFLQVLQIMAHALQNPSPILLLDEPDAHMHHSLQKSFLKLLRQFANEENLQIIMASHSESFIRETPIQEIRVINSDLKESDSSQI